MYTQPVPSTSIYIHIPFCSHRCSYCDFNTYTGMGGLIPDYVKALCNEADIYSRASPKIDRIGTIYFGGGTPSLLRERYIALILEKLTKLFNIEPGAEITLEVNPKTVTQEYLNALHNCGVNRLSIGVQSSNPFDLKILERTHEYIDVIHTVNWSRKAGFDNISLDMIFGIPGQSMVRWQHSLGMVLRLKPEHISLYALTIEGETALGKWKIRGLVEPQETDLEADMYEWASDFLYSNGYHQYEISNWARKNPDGWLLTSHHNLQYWQNLPYLGLGAGAHSCLNKKRVENIRSPINYIEYLREYQDKNLNNSTEANEIASPLSPVILESETIDSSKEMSETMMLGLRLVDQGISKSSFFNRFGTHLEDVYGDEINKLIRLGLLKWVDHKERIVLSRKGRALGNQVFIEFI